MKKKILGLLIVVFAFTMTIGTGFAAWVITRPAETSATAAIVAEDVSDASYKVLFNTETSMATEQPLAIANCFRFVGNTAVDSQTGWLRSTDTDLEDLSETIAIHVSDRDGESSKITYAASMTVTVDPTAVLNAAKLSNNEILVTIDSIKLGNSNLTLDDGGKYNITVPIPVNANGGFDVDLVITFAWGGHFNSNNPYTYFNGKTVDDLYDGSAYQFGESGSQLSVSSTSTWADDAMASLKALFALNTQTVGVQVKVVAANS